MGVLEEALSSIRGTGSSNSATLDAPSSGFDLGSILQSIRSGTIKLKGKKPSDLYPRQEPEQQTLLDTAVRERKSLQPSNTFPITANDKVAQALRAIRARLPQAKEAAATALETPMFPGGGKVPGIPSVKLGEAAQMTMESLSLPFEAVKKAVVVPLSKAAKALGIEDVPLYGVGPIPGYKDLTIRQGIELIGEGASLYFTPKAIEAIPKIADKILFETVKYPAMPIAKVIPFDRLRQLQGGAPPLPQEIAVMQGAEKELKVPRFRMSSTVTEKGIQPYSIYEPTELETVLKRDSHYDVAVEAPGRATPAPTAEVPAEGPATSGVTAVAETAVEGAAPVDPLAAALAEIRMPTKTPEIPAVSPAPVATELKLTKSQRESLQKAREDLVQGEPGYRHIIKAGENDPNANKTVLPSPSTYPDWFKNQGWSSKDAIHALDKALEGKSLTAKQHTIVQAAFNPRTEKVREILADRVIKEVTAGDLKEGDQFKIEGEKFKVVDTHPEEFPPKVTIKDGQTITIQGDEPLKIDRGTLQSGAETPAGDPLTLAIEAVRQGKPIPHELTLPGMPGREMPAASIASAGSAQVPDEELLTGLKPAEASPQEELPLAGGGSHASRGPSREDFIRREATAEKVTIKPVDMPELVELTKEISGNWPQVSRRMGANTRGLFIPGKGIIRLRPDIFTDPKQAAQTFAHEIGHLIDWLPDKSMARGNILGRVYSLRKFMKDVYGNLEEGGQVSSYRNKELREELTAVSEWWRPYNKETSSASFKRYRGSSEELYADALSVLFNTPGELESRAPKFFKSFFEALDRKPFVKEQFFALQVRLNEGFESVMTRRLKNIEEGGVKSEELFRQKRAEKMMRDRHIWERTRMAVDDVFYPITKRVHDLEARGIDVPEGINPKFAVDELTLADNRNHTMLRQIDESVLTPLKNADLDSRDLHPYMFAKRVLADRSGLANPYGTAPENAKQLLVKLQQDLGPDRYTALEKTANQFHDIIWKSVEEGHDLGVFSDEVFEKLKANKDAYVTFTALDYASDYVPAGIKAQVGTLKEIGDTFLQTTLKMISLNRLNALQVAKRNVRDLLQEFYPAEITKAKVMNPQDKIHQFKREEQRGHLEMLEDGKMVAYNVDPLVAESFEKYRAGDLAVLGGMLRKFLLTKPFKALFITYNPGFALAFNPIRDFKRTYKSIPGATIGNLLKAYKDALPTAIRKNLGVSDKLIDEMVDNKALSAEFGDFFFDPSEDEYTRMLERYHILKMEGGKVVTPIGEIRKKLMKPFVQLLEGIRFAGSVIETMPKIAGYQLRKAQGEAGRRLTYNTRNYTGTPNFTRAGYATPVTNAIYMFSNIIKEGMKADWILASSPKTRNGYWWKTAKIDLMPKLAMMAAAAGATGSFLKGFFDRVPEYDKTNYIVVPLGIYPGGDYGWKAIYMRFPHDETSRLYTALFWKMGNALKGDPTAFNQIFDFGAGQMPNVAPTLTILGTWGKYLAGHNPYSSFKGTNVLSDLEYKAGGWPALKKMVLWTANQSGQFRFATYDDTTKTTTEKVLEATPLFNRLIKITDYGMKELEKSAAAPIQSEKAKERLEERDIKRHIEAALRSGKSDFGPDLKTGIEKLGFDKKDIKEIIQKGSRMELQNRIEALPFDEAMAVYRAMGDDEKKVLGPIMAKKFGSTMQRGDLKTLERALGKK